MAAAAVDVGYLATHLGVSQDTLTSVTSNPTTALVQAVLAAVAAKARDFDELASQKVVLEVELETQIRAAESQRDASNETARKALKDVEDIRQQLHQEGMFYLTRRRLAASTLIVLCATQIRIILTAATETKRQTLENELQSIKSSTSSSQSEIETLRGRIASLETSNREALAIIDTKNSANDTLSQELQAQHQKNLKLNQEITSLQQAVQHANNTVNAAKIKEQSLQQQNDMVQRSADFYENELKTKTAEAMKYRKEKGARITELQRLNDDASANIDSLKRTEQQLRQRLDEAQKKAEDGWTKVQQLQESAARAEEDFRQEIDASKRLAFLKDQQANTHKERLREVESRLEQVKKEGEDTVRRISAELEEARQAQDLSSTEIDNLKAEITRLEAALAGSAVPRGSPGQPGSAPQTPRLGPLSSSLFGRPGSPFATPGSSQKSVSATQALNEVYRLKNLLAVEKQRYQTLQKEFDEMISQLEAKGPEIDELQNENERLQREIQNMSHLSDESFKEREIAKKEARRAEKAFNNAQAEMNILRNQVRDLSAQMQVMMFNMEHRDHELTLEETLELQRISKGGNLASSDLSNDDRVIMERLVTYTDIKNLQEKNVELLGTIHELTEQMRNAEDAAAQQEALHAQEENVHLKKQLEDFEDKFRTFKVRTESIMKERDMFRRMIEDRVSGEELASVVGRDGVLASIEQHSTMGDDGADYTTLLRDLQQNFDAYREEQATDRESLKKQGEELASKTRSLQAENSKLSSQLSLQVERYEMIQSNFVASQSENKELQKRMQSLSEQAAKQDLRTQQAAEELVEVRSEVDGLRNENANLKAEKKLWKDIQDRLSSDNENLVQEKSRLNGLIATQQSLQNERDLGEAETRRRLQAQIDTLEAEVNTTKRKLSDEVEEGKKLQLRKEFDSQQAQKRIDELTTTLSTIREELVATKTSKDHLQTRVDELTIQLRSAEERATRLQPRPTPRPGTMTPGSDQTALAQDTDERIQELIHEASDLKQELELTKTHLDNAKAQAEQFRELSQASEDQLQELNAAQDQYTEEMDASLSAKDAAIKELQQRVEDLSTELGKSNAELSALHDSQAEVARHFESEKAILDEEVKRLKGEEENYLSASQFHKQDIRIQAQIAARAQEQYENEVAKHGETAKNLAIVRAELNQLKTAAATMRAEAESAKTLLLQNESSWDEQRKRFEQELSELQSRRNDANAQNKLLHQQLENVASQVSALQHSRTSTGESLDAIAGQPTSSSEDGLREINNYLRREKDILEVQFDMKTREAKRLQEQLDYAQSQLDESRLKLEEERRSQVDQQRLSISHKELMGRIEELNLFRESNVTLRSEAQQVAAVLEEKKTKITELESKVQPLEARTEELQSQLAFKEAEMKQLQEDRDRWQKRTEDILSKHGRTDPAEVEELKQKVATLEEEINGLQAAEQPLKDKIQELEKTVKEKEDGWAASREKLVNQFKERSRNQTAAIKETAAHRDRLQVEFDESSSQLISTKAELEAEKKERLAAAEQIQNFQRQVQALQEAAQQNPGVAAPAGESTADAVGSEAVAEVERQLAEAKTELASVHAERAALDEELQALRAQLDTAIGERDQARADAESNRANGDMTMENGASAISTVPGAALTDEERSALENKVAAAEAQAAEFEAKIKEIEENQEAIVKERSDKMKTALNNKIKEKNAQMEQEREQMRNEVTKQREDWRLQLEQERKIWEAEQISAKPPGTPAQQTAPAPAPATPGTPATIPASLDGMSDADVRKFVSTNQTVKEIITNNVRHKVAEATRKVKEECEQSHISKSEHDQKITQARAESQKLAESKANVRVNMAQNRLRNTDAKLHVVEVAATETPEKPVGEVWEVAKVAKPAPLPPKPKPVTASPSTTPAANTSAGRFNIASAGRSIVTDQRAAPVQPAATSNSNGTTPHIPQPTTVSGLPKPQLPSLSASVGAASSIPQNPFTSSTSAPSAAASVSNPFASSTNSTGQAAPPTGQQQSAQHKSAIPVPGAHQPKSGLRPPTGTYQAPGTRGTTRGGRGGNVGRGGGHPGGRPSLNPHADHFQPGNKRPRGDSEVGAGGNGAQKRMRGGAAGAQ
jgi:nucleoprotein TPR